MRTGTGGRFAAGLAMGVGLALLPALGAAGPANAVEPSTLEPGAAAHVFAKPKPKPPGKGAKPATPPGQQKSKPKPKPPKDTTPPPVPVVSSTTVSPKGSVAMVVTAEAGSEIRVTNLTGRVSRVATVTATGAPQTLEWRTTHGSHVYKVLAVDDAKNSSDERIVSVKVDARAPQVRVFKFTPGTADDPVSMLRFSTENGAAYRLLVGKKLVSRGTIKGGELETALDLRDGKHTVRIELQDDTGNRSVTQRQVKVKVGSLNLDVEHVSEPTEATQVFEVTGPKGTTGILKIGDAASSRFDLKRGSATVEVELTDGDYEADVSVTDKQGRSGGVQVPAFTVDTTAPEVSLSVDPAESAEGTFAVDLTTEEGSTVDWELTTADGTPVDDGFVVGTGGTQRIERQVDEGSYQLTVTATDALGNAAQDEVDARVTAAPVIGTAALAFLLGLGLLLLVWLLLGVVLAWRRQKRTGNDLSRFQLWLAAVTPWRTAAEQRAAKSDYRAAVETYEKRSATYDDDLARWEERRFELATLVDVTERGGEPARGLLPAGVKALPGERLLTLIPVTVVDAPTDRIEDLDEREGGTLTVTDRRLILDGAERRIWKLDEVERVRHLAGDHTLFRMKGEEAWSGIGYADVDLARSYLQVALAGDSHDRASLARTFRHGLEGHEMLKPEPPVHPDAEPVAATEPDPEPAPEADEETATLEELIGAPVEDSTEDEAADRSVPAG